MSLLFGSPAVASPPDHCEKILIYGASTQVNNSAWNKSLAWYQKQCKKYTRIRDSWSDRKAQLHYADIGGSQSSKRSNYESVAKIMCEAARRRTTDIGKLMVERRYLPPHVTDAWKKCVRAEKKHGAIIEASGQSTSPVAGESILSELVISAYCVIRFPYKDCKLHQIKRRELSNMTCKGELKNATDPGKPPLSLSHTTARKMICKRTINSKPARGWKPGDVIAPQAQIRFITSYKGNYLLTLPAVKVPEAVGCKNMKIPDIQFPAGGADRRVPNIRCPGLGKFPTNITTTLSFRMDVEGTNKYAPRFVTVKLGSNCGSSGTCRHYENWNGTIRDHSNGSVTADLVSAKKGRIILPVKANCKWAGKTRCLMRMVKLSIEPK